MNRQNTEDLQGTEKTPQDILLMDVYLYTFDQIHRICTTLRVNTKVNYGLWMIMMCQCGFILDNKCISLMSNIDPGEGYTCVGAGVYIYGKALYLPSNFFVNLKLLLKNTVGLPW